MTDARDPVRLMDEERVDPALRAALRQVSSAEPSTAEVAALVERVGDGLSASADSASWLSQFVSQSGGLKLMAMLVAGGAALWGAARTLPVQGGRDVAAMATHEVERAAAEAGVEPARMGRESEHAAGNTPVAAGDRPALPTENITRSEPLSASSPSPSLSLPRGGREWRSPSLSLPRGGRESERSFAGRHGAHVKSATHARGSAVVPAASAASTDEAAPREQDAATDGEESELALITRAQSALKVAPKRALELLDRHDTLYPTGHFAEEREVLWIDALIQLGMTRALKARAQRFLANYPSSIHCARVRSLLEAARRTR